MFQFTRDTIKNIIYIFCVIRYGPRSGEGVDGRYRRCADGRMERTFFIQIHAFDSCFIKFRRLISDLICILFVNYDNIPNFKFVLQTWRNKGGFTLIELGESRDRRFAVHRLKVPHFILIFDSIKFQLTNHLDFCVNYDVVNFENVLNNFVKQINR